MNVKRRKHYEPVLAELNGFQVQCINYSVNITTLVIIHKYLLRHMLALFWFRTKIMQLVYKLMQTFKFTLLTRNISRTCSRCSIPVFHYIFKCKSNNIIRHYCCKFLYSNYFYIS